MILKLKNKYFTSKCPTFLEDVDIYNVLISNKIPSSQYI